MVPYIKDNCYERRNTNRLRALSVSVQWKKQLVFQTENIDLHQTTCKRYAVAYPIDFFPMSFALYSCTALFGITNVPQDAFSRMKYTHNSAFPTTRSRRAERTTIDRTTHHLSPQLHGVTVETSLVFQCSCDHDAVSTPQISPILPTSATSAATGMVFIGSLSHMPPPLPSPWKRCHSVSYVIILSLR